MKTIEDDIHILNNIRKGDKESFNRLFDTFFVPLCRFMYIYIENKQVIEELVLDIFAYIWEHRDTFTISISIKAYLFQSARNKCFNYIRDNKETVPLNDNIPNPNDDTASELELYELEQIIQEAVMSLPDKCKTVFDLSRNKNKTNQEIAEQLKISVKTVEGHITKALKHIKHHLGNQYHYLW